MFLSDPYVHTIAIPVFKDASCISVPRRVIRPGFAQPSTHIIPHGRAAKRKHLRLRSHDKFTMCVDLADTMPVECPRGWNWVDDSIRTPTVEGRNQVSEP